MKSDEGNKKDITSTVISDRYVASNYRRDAHSFALKSKSEIFHPSETTDTGTRIKSKLKEEHREEKQEFSKKLCEESKDSISESDSKLIVAVCLPLVFVILKLNIILNALSLDLFFYRYGKRP